MSATEQRPWGYYWVTTRESDEPTIAEWCCADARRNEGCWWFCGSGAYDPDPEQVEEVLAGPLEPPPSAATGPKP